MRSYDTQIPAAWNETATPFPRDATIHRLFEEQATRTPAAPAVTGDGGTLTYRDLDRRANQLAHRLRELGAMAGTRVGVCMPRSPELVVTLLAVLKAGAAYVPLDPDYPVERLAFMASDAQLALIVTAGSSRERLPAIGHGPVLDLVAERVAIAAMSDLPPRCRGVGPRCGAYVMYTSGSTGQPKGAIVLHRGVVRLVRDTNYIEIGPRDCVAQVANCSFDAATFEIWGALLNGARLDVISHDAALSPALFAETLRVRGIDVLFLTPALFSRIAQTEPRAFASIRDLVVGGDVLEPRWVRQVQQAGGPKRIINGYGPTEATVFSSFHEVAPLPDNGDPIPIGKPISNTRLYVLDPHLQPVAVGTRGELFVGGDGVGGGYLGRPELTAECFLPDPFVIGDPEARMYRTGDQVRLSPELELEFLGRLDHQIKLRGFRIETGEVEAALVAHPAIREAAVVVQEVGPDDRQLVAYTVPRDREVSQAALIEHLRARLPGHMVPSIYVTLGALPLTNSAKVDRKALPSPPRNRPAEVSHLAPRTALEHTLAAIWREVLQVDQLGVRDDFFAIGGESLRAMRVLARIRQRLGVEVPIRRFFEQRTIERLAEQIQALRSEASVEAPLPVVLRGGFLPLSFAQQRLLFLHQMAPDSTAYHCPSVLRLRGLLDDDALRHAIAELGRRHESLRTTFGETEDGRPTQQLSTAALVGAYSDLSSLPEPERASRLAELTEAVIRDRFDLGRGPLTRVALIRLGIAEHQLIINMHHIVTDGWSIGVLHRELWALYAGFAEHRASGLSEPALHYVDYAASQTNQRDRDRDASELAYWRTQLAGAPAVLELPADRPRPIAQTFRGGEVRFRVDRDIALALAVLAAGQRATVPMVLLAAFEVLLYRYARQADFLVGVTHGNRDRADLEDVVGIFVNTLALRADLSGDPTFRELVGRTRETSLAAYAHARLPFEQVVEATEPTRAASHNPLVQVLFGPQVPGFTAASVAGLGVDTLPCDAGGAVFDLSFFYEEDEAGIAATLQYSADLFDHATITRMAEHLTLLLGSATREPDQRVSALPMLSETERHQLVVEWNANATPAPSAPSVHALFEAGVASRRSITAIVCGDRQLSYGELNRRANQLAHHLRALGVGPGTPVGVCLERSLEAMVAILAVLKAGGAYVPMDPSYPEHWLRFILDDTRAPVVVTTAALTRKWLTPSAQRVDLDQQLDWLDRYPASDGAGGQVEPDQLAYVIYTSGSTARPKGVAMPHRALINLLTWQLASWGAGAVARTLQLASINFDVSFQEVFSTWLAGGTLVLAPDEARLCPTRLWALIGGEAIERVFLPPVILQRLAEEAPDAATSTGLREIICAGEQLVITPPLERLLGAMPGCSLHNHYGPTETHVVTAGQVPSPARRGPASIGRPIHNTQIYLLDSSLAPVPIGVPGELYVGGAGLARGYLGREDLTAEQFVPDPFSSAVGSRLYRTGDLARFCVDGTIEFLGRVDHQVKLRGFRIELGAIEAALREHPGVQDAAVDVRASSPGDRRLVAYVVEHALSPDPRALAVALRAFLRTHLPAYMIPSCFVTVASLPLSRSGKLERRALPEPPTDSEVGVALVSPRDEVERALVAIWQDVLGVGQVNIDDDFFLLGGHSLLVARLVSAIRDRLGVAIPLRVVFDAPTIGELARFVSARTGPSAAPPVLEQESALDPSIFASGQLADAGGEILLTGATGYVGAFVLAELLARTDGPVHCLVRARNADDGLARIQRNLARHHLWTDAMQGRVWPVLGDLGRPRLGLDECAFTRLGARLAAIVHGGALVHHLYGYRTLKAANVGGTEEVLRLACVGRTKPVHFLSTLGAVVADHDGASPLMIRESGPTGALERLSNGYCQSKCVAEHLVVAAQARGVPTAIYRLGAISGDSVTGVCNADDFLYRLIRGCLALGVAFDLDYEMRMTPADYMARAVVALAQRPASLGRVFHVSNPEPLYWLELVRTLRAAGYRLEVAPYGDWLARLHDVRDAGIGNPLLPLLPLLQQRAGDGTRYQMEDYFVPVVTDCAGTLAGLSGTGVDCPPADRALIGRYLNYLTRHGLLEIG